MNTRRAVYFARHGETPWNQALRWQGHTDIALSDVGRRQARELAERVRGLGVVRVHASDLCRAGETAQIVAAALGITVPVAVDPGFRERGFGVFEGLTRDECVANHPDEWARYTADSSNRIPPGGEPLEQVRARMRAATLRAAAALPAGDTGDAGAALVVSHGSSMRLLVGTITGVVPPPLVNGALYRVWVALPDGFAGAEPVA